MDARVGQFWCDRKHNWAGWQQQPCNKQQLAVLQGTGLYARVI